MLTNDEMNYREIKWNKFKQELREKGWCEGEVEDIAWSAYNIGIIVGEYEEKKRVILEKYINLYNKD